MVVPSDDMLKALFKTKQARTYAKRSLSRGYSVDNLVKDTGKLKKSVKKQQKTKQSKQSPKTKSVSMPTMYRM